MGNPQHLEWLMEGVESWNERRKQDDFVPDFSGVDIPQAFEKAGLLGSAETLNLRGIDMSGADLSRAKLFGGLLDDAIFFEAVLWKADLSGSSLQSANFRDASLRETEFRGANLRDAELIGASLRNANFRTLLSDLRTLFVDIPGAFPGKPKHTDLRIRPGVTQEKLSEAHGDTGVLLPEGLVHPDHWPDFEALDHSTDALSGLPAMERQVTEATIEGLMAHAALHKVHARATAETIRAVIGGSLAAGTNDLPRVLRITASIADVLDFTSDAFERDAKALRARVEDLETQVAALNVALRDAEARAEAEASLAAGLRSQIDAGQDGFWTSFAKTNGEQAAKLPYFMAKIGVVFYVATLLGPNHPLVKLLFDTLNAFNA